MFCHSLVGFVGIAAAEIQQAKALVNWQNLELDESTQRARLMKKGMSIDLGGIAKGMALDEVRKIYANYGIEHGLINLGASSLYAIGSKADGNDWRVGLRHPRNEAVSYTHLTLPTNREV